MDVTGDGQPGTTTGTTSTGRRRRTWPAALIGTGVLGAATLTFTLVSPLGASSADASELPAFRDCDALAEHMSDLALDRLADSRRRAYDEYTATEDVAADLALPVPPPMPGVPAPQAVPGSGPLAATNAQKADASTAGAAGAEAPRAMDAPAAAPAPAAAGRSAGADPSDAVGSSASGTNTQEAGVDEADLAKTDGRLLVTVRDRSLVVLDVAGQTPRRLGSVRLTGQRALELLLAGDRAVVVGTADSRERYLDDEAGARSRGAAALTTLSVVDLSDPARPRVVSTEEITARYLSARMTGDTVRVVLSSTPDVLRGLSGLTDGWRGRDDRGLEDARERLARVPGEDWLPMRRSVDREARSVSETPLLDCSDVRYPVTDSGLDLLTVLSLDTGLDDAIEQAAATALVGSGDLVYATTEKLFVATTDGGWDDGWDDFRGGRSGVTTRVHSFDITGDGAEYLASGRVDGYLYGRWAMSEKGGLLRMVTTSTAPWRRGGSTETGVVVLDTDGKRMREIGRVDGMGLTETVRAVRWFDDVAAIVTFRQTDPLYLVDLSRPESPRVRGELKIPGYSAYLHPIGDHRLLGVGQDGDNWGATRGLQVSNFDILDLTDPRRTDALGFGPGTSSPVEQDPRGFVYLPSESLAVLPVFSYREGRNGLVAIGVTDNGRLRRLATWYDSDRRRVIKVMPLGDGRIVALDHEGVRIFDAESLRLHGSAYYR